MKPQIQPVISLWIMVALSLMIVLAISLTEDFHIGKYRPTRATFRETLLATPLQQTPDTVTTDTILPVAVDTLVEPDTTIRKVLIFGDSMTHNLAMSIARYGSRNNYKVTSVTWESSSILAWGTDPKLSEYLAEVKPDFVIVSLGSNEM